MLETNIQNHFFHQFWSKDYCKMAALKEILPYLLSSWIHDLKSWSEILNWLYCRAKEKQLFVAMIYDVNWGGNPPHTSNASEHRLWTPNEARFFGLGQTNCADKFWGIWGILGQTISTHLGIVSPLSMFSIIHPCRLWAEIEAHKWLFLVLLVDHMK